MDDLKIKALRTTTALHNDCLAEIGRVTANFALLEVKLKKLIYYLLGTSERDILAITSEMSFQRMPDLATSLLTEQVELGHVNSAREAELRTVLKSISSAKQKRNTISHSLWGASSVSSVVRTKYTSKRRKGLFFQREEMSVEDISMVAVEIAAATSDLDTFARAVSIEVFKNRGKNPDLKSSDLSVL